MSNRIEFAERLTNYYRYPRICLFQDQIGDKDDFVSFLQQQHPRKKQFYIYIHIPFCTSMCNYCPFYHTYYPQTDAEGVSAFVNALLLELRRYAAEPFVRTAEIVNVNFGGGTPFILPTHELVKILEVVHEVFNLHPEPVISIEGDPKALQDKDKLRALKAAGITRASFGIQTFNERLRRRLAVESTTADVYKCVESLQKAGIDEWGCDMLYNCPDQNVTEIKYNVDRICELQPSIVDAYDLNISPNTKLSDMVMGGRFSRPPSNSAEIEQFRALRETFFENGFSQVRSVNFAPPGVVINRRGILHQFSEDVLGIGPSARSFLYSAGRNYRNHCSTEKYIQDIAHGEYPIEAGNIVPQSVLEERDLMLFPYYLEVPKSSLNYPRFRDKIEDMVRSGYVEDRGDTLALTELGRLWPGNIQYYFHSDEEKEAMANSMFFSLQKGTNLFNQDRVNVPKSRGARRQ